MTATLPDLVARAADKWGDAIAVVFDETGDQLSFADIERESGAIAGRLAAAGVVAGDRVAVMLRNVAAFPLTWLAIARLGAAMVPLNVNYRAADAGYILAHAAPRAIVADAEFKAVLDAAADDLSEVPTWLWTDRRGLALIAGAPPAPTGVVSAEALTNIQYTSGTTGHPKGCMLPNDYWPAMVERILTDVLPLDTQDVMLTAQPFYYLDPQWNLAVALTCGARLVVLDGFHPSTLWSKLREYKVTFFYCLGAMPGLLLKMPPDPADRDNRLRLVMCSAIPPTQHEALENRWGVPWREAFGMTETGCDLAVTADEHGALVGSACIGRPMTGREARVVDGEGRPVGPGLAGELVLRGTGIMQGYYRNAAATAEAFHGGWFHTGDIVRQDEAGRFYYISRKKDMIRRGGENISAAEVEEVIQSHSAVFAVACVPEPDEIRGEEVKAIVLLADGNSPDDFPPAALIGFCEAKLARFKIPRYWTYRATDFPRTPSERIAKQVLIAEERERQPAIYDCVGDVWR